MIILAIDLGKFNSMCCFFDTETQEYWFWTAATTRFYLTSVFQSNQIDLVVMEACGPSSWVSDLCQESTCLIGTQCWTSRTVTPCAEQLSLLSARTSISGCWNLRS